MTQSLRPYAWLSL